jgi:hypothetical protein
MLFVVETDAEDGCRLKWRKDLAGDDGLVGYTVCSKEVAFETAGGAFRLEGCILNGTVVCLVSDDAHGWCCDKVFVGRGYFPVV